MDDKTTFWGGDNGNQYCNYRPPVDNYGRRGIMENSTVIIDRRSIITVLISIIPTPTVMSLLQPPSDYQALSALLYKNVIITTLPSGQ